jgi:F0F1-type ATP synthase membrane subunit b/b'
MHFDATFFALVALIIFLGIAAYAGAFRSMGAGLDARSARIQKDLDDAARLRKEAEALAEISRSAPTPKGSCRHRPTPRPTRKNTP